MKKQFGKYGLPLDVIFCSKCTRSNQRPHNVGEFNQTSRDKKKYVVLETWESQILEIEWYSCFSQSF